MRSNTLDAARRVYNFATRVTIHKVNDDPKRQTVDYRGLHDELITDVEHHQPYGFSSVPMPPDKDGKAAEAIAIHFHGDRSNTVVFGADDRRYRPKKWKPGESGTYHHSGAFAKHTDDGFVHDQGNEKKPMTWKVNKSSVVISDGTITSDVDGTNVKITKDKVEVTVGGTVLVVTAGKISFGSEGASIPVMLQSGPSSLLFSDR